MSCECLLLHRLLGYSLASNVSGYITTVPAISNGILTIHSAATLLCHMLIAYDITPLFISAFRHMVDDQCAIDSMDRYY